MQIRTYFLYRHVRLDTNVPFYIGIGTKSLKEHYSFKFEYTRAFFAGKSRNSYWKNIVNKTKYRVDILYETNSQEEIIEKEKEFISLYKSTLCNLTEGGFGLVGYIPTEETKNKLSNFQKNRKRKRGYKLNLSEQGRLNIGISVSTRKVFDSTKKKISDKLKNNKNGLNHKVSEINKKKLIERSKKVVYQYSLDNKLLKEWYSVSEAARQLDFSFKCISKCCLGKLKSYKGFIWKYNKEVVDIEAEQ